MTAVEQEMARQNNVAVSIGIRSSVMPLPPRSIRAGESVNVAITTLLGHTIYGAEDTTHAECLAQYHGHGVV